MHTPQIAKMTFFSCLSPNIIEKIQKKKFKGVLLYARLSVIMRLQNPGRKWALLYTHFSFCRFAD
jgi:hypothetical protein